MTHLMLAGDFSLFGIALGPVFGFGLIMLIRYLRTRKIQYLWWTILAAVLSLFLRYMSHKDIDARASEATSLLQ